MESFYRISSMSIIETILNSHIISESLHRPSRSHYYGVYKRVNERSNEEWKRKKEEKKLSIKKKISTGKFTWK